MPTYNFRDKQSGEVTEMVMSMSGREQFLKDNPHLEQVILAAPVAADPIRIGVKNSGGFKEVLQKIHATTPGSVLNRTTNI